MWITWLVSWYKITHQMNNMQTLFKTIFDLTCTENMSDFSHALSWKMSLILQRYSDDFQTILYEQTIRMCLSSFIHPLSNSFVLIRISILSHLSIMWQSCDNVVPIYLTPMSASSLVSSAIPPGLSDTVTTNRMSRPSAAKPRSMTRPRAVVSMLPPQSATTTLIQNWNG